MGKGHILKSSKMFKLLLILSIIALAYGSFANTGGCSSDANRRSGECCYKGKCGKKPLLGEECPWDGIPEKYRHPGQCKCATGLECPPTASWMGEPTCWKIGTFGK